MELWLNNKIQIEEMLTKVVIGAWCLEMGTSLFCNLFFDNVGKEWIKVVIKVSYT